MFYFCIASETRVCAVFIDIVNIKYLMKKNILKKLFVKIIKSLGYEIIDQSEFRSPSLNKDLNEKLSNINKSIILPLGEVKLTVKFHHFLLFLELILILKFGTKIKKEFLKKSKIEYVKRSLNSLIKAIKKLKENYNSINITIKVVDDNSTKENLAHIKTILPLREKITK